MLNKLIGDAFRDNRLPKDEMVYNNTKNTAEEISDSRFVHTLSAFQVSPAVLVQYNRLKSTSTVSKRFQKLSVNYMEFWYGAW